MMNKKGAEHVEMIMSFIVFIGMLAFLIYMFPFYQPEKSRTGLVIAERAILDYSDMNLTSFTIITDLVPPADPGCFYVPENEPVRAIVKNDARGPVQATLGSSFSRLYARASGKFYEIYLSPKFIENNDGFDTGPCTPLATQTSYKTGMKISINAVSYERLLQLNASYSSNYNNARDGILKIKDNFAFSYRNLSGGVIIKADRKKPSRVDVLSEDIPMQMFYSDGSSTFGLINVQIW
jgi:hypothetical protein